MNQINKIVSASLTALLGSIPAAAVAKTVQIRALNTNQSVTVHYQSTYLSPDQLNMIAPQVLYQTDASTGQTVAELLASQGNGIPSLSHTWLEANRAIQFSWNGAALEFNESTVISWLPAAESISPESTWQSGANYSLDSTDSYMNGATANPVAELAIIASHIRTHGPSYQLHPYVTKQYSLADYSVNAQLKRAGEARSCSCRNGTNESGATVCKIGLAGGGTYTVGGSCDDSCSAQGSALPLLAASCTSVDIQ